MPRPIVIAHHLICTAYGWWLPNDPRGSTSRCIASEVVAELGELHRGRKRIQPASCQIRAFYQRAPYALKHELLQFSPQDTQAIAEAFGVCVQEHRYTCYACAILSDHIHILLRKHKHTAEEMIAHLQAHSALLLFQRGLRHENHPVWATGGWKVFLDHPDDIWRTIDYIERNPQKVRMTPQRWGFVQAYDGWPLHPGHDPNSPYARRLRDGS